jgi:MipA family protein
MLRIQTLLIALSVFTAAPACAEEVAPVTTLLGAGAWSRPAYDGADTNQTALIPVVRYYGQPWFARTTFGLLEGGVRTELFSGFSIGAQLAYEGGRNSAESAYLSVHNIVSFAPSLSWGLHAELEKNIGPMPLIVLLRYRQDVDGDRGAQADLRLTAGLYGDHGINAGIFVQTTWANTQSAQYYYGISAQQSVASGLAVNTMQSGQLFDAAGLLWSYDLDVKWMLLGSFELHQLHGGALNSPLVQVSAGHYASLGLAYQF